MWSVAMTDFFQMIIILVGMVAVAWFFSDKAGGTTHVISQAIQDGKFSLFGTDGMSFTSLIAVISAILTMGFGSIPQQDVFQRVLSADSEKNASRGAIIGGSFYMVFAFIPILLAYSAFMIAPELIKTTGDTQRILPALILEQAPLLLQVLFF